MEEGEIDEVMPTDCYGTDSRRATLDSLGPAPQSLFSLVSAPPSSPRSILLPLHSASGRPPFCIL